MPEPIGDLATKTILDKLTHLSVLRGKADEADKYVKFMEKIYEAMGLAKMLPEVPEDILDINEKAVAVQAIETAVSFNAWLADREKNFTVPENS